MSRSETPMYGCVQVPYFDQRRGRPPHEVDGDRVAVAAAWARADQRRQPDHLAVEIHERSTRIAWIHLGVRLQIDLSRDAIAAVPATGAGR